MSSTNPKDPRQRAKEYKQEPTEESSPQRKPPRSPAEWRDAVSQAIEDAMRQGEFDNLRGKGKPLNLNKNPYAPEGSNLAFDLLKNNDLVPGWIGSRGELLRDIEKWRARLRDLAARSMNEHTLAAPSAREQIIQRWQGQRQALQLEAESLNKRITDVNLAQPISSLEIFKLRLDEELRKAGAAEPLL